MKMKKKEVAFRLWLVIAYFVMWYICYLADRHIYIMEYTNITGMESFFVVLGSNINLLAKGLILFLIPYEFIFSWLSQEIFDIVTIFNPSKLLNKVIKRKYIDVALLVLIYVGLFVFLEKYYFYIRWQLAYGCSVLTLLAALISYLLYDIIDNRVTRYIVSCVVVNVLNAVACYIITPRFISGVIIYSLMIVSWHLYDGLIKKKMWCNEIVASAACSFLLFVAALNCTGHYTNWTDFIDPYNARCNDSSSMMIFLRNNPFLSAKFAINWEYVQHPFIGINVFLGTPILIIYMILFVSTLVVAVLQIRETAKNNVKRACIFAHIFLWYVFIYLYKLFCDMGILPEASMTFMGIYYYVPMMALLFRSLWIGKKCTTGLLEQIIPEESDDDCDLLEEVMDSQIDIQSSLTILEKRLTVLEKRCKNLENKF